MTCGGINISHRKIGMKTGLCSQCSRQTTLMNCASLRFTRYAPSLLSRTVRPGQTHLAVRHFHCHEQEAVSIEALKSIIRWLHQILLFLLASPVWRPASRSGFSLSKFLISPLHFPFVSIIPPSFVFRRGTYHWIALQALLQ